MSNVKKTYVKRSAPSKPSSLVCCRACLATDGKLYNMHEYKLMDAFTRFSGITMRHDKLPQHLCSYCAALLRRCSAFQAKCGRAQLCLLSGLMQKDFSLEYVRSIDRITNNLSNDLTTSGLTTTIIEEHNITGITPKQNKVNNIDRNNDNESNNVDMNDDNESYNVDTNDDNESNNVDTNDDNESNNVDTNDDNGSNNVDTNDNNDTSNIDTNNDKNTTNNKDKNKDKNTTNNYKNTPYPYIKYMYGLNVEGKTEIDLDDDNSNGDVDDADNLIVDIGRFIVRDIEEIVKKKKIEPVIKKPRRNNYNRRKKEKVEKEKAAKNEPKKPVYREERIFRIDLAKYERTYNMKIVTLTKEQQLKEIETRKQSARYKDSAFHCEECGRGFQIEAAFRNHRNKHDLSAGDHPCEICTVRFRRHNFLLRHKDSHSTQIVCQECGFISRTRGQAVVHYRTHAGKKYCCKYCGKTCSTMSHYLTHLRFYHPTENVSCEMCGEMFLGLKGVWQHKAITHSVYMTQEYKCAVCSKIFISSEALKTHTESAADGHQELSPCDMCGHNLMSEELLQQHMVEQHPKCDLCHQTFLTVAAHRTHHKRKHLGERFQPMTAGIVRRRTKQQKKSFRQNKYMCEYCGKMQPCQAVLLEHKRRHENVRPFACTQCPKRFYTRPQYKSHMRTHTGEKPFQCDHCSLTFGIKQNMERHILNKHLGMTPKVPCELCGRLFTTRGSIKLHVRTVHGGQPGPRRDRRPKAKRALDKSAEGVATDQ